MGYAWRCQSTPVCTILLATRPPNRPPLQVQELFGKITDIQERAEATEAAVQVRPPARVARAFAYRYTNTTDAGQKRTVPYFWLRLTHPYRLPPRTCAGDLPRHPQAGLRQASPDQRHHQPAPPRDAHGRDGRPGAGERRGEPGLIAGTAILAGGITAGWGCEEDGERSAAGSCPAASPAWSRAWLGFAHANTVTRRTQDRGAICVASW